MPIYRNPFEKGRLIIQFVVIFPEPKQMTPSRITALEKYLPPREESIVPDDAEEVSLVEYSDSHARTGGARPAGYEHMEDDDEEGHPHGQAVQCGTQ